MFNVQPPELLLILVVALLVLGPTRLPDAARQLGRAMSELRRIGAGFQAEMRDAMQESVPPPEPQPALELPTMPELLDPPADAAVMEHPPAPPEPTSEGAKAAKAPKKAVKKRSSVLPTKATKAVKGTATKAVKSTKATAAAPRTTKPAGKTTAKRSSGSSGT